MTSNTLTTLRIGLFGLTGIVCLAYATLALLYATPAPFSAWIPGAFGISSGVILAITSRMAPAKAASMTWDEGYAADASRAASRAFWIAIFQYPVFGVLMALGLATPSVSFAAMGTLTAAAYLLMAAWFDMQGRA